MSDRTPAGDKGTADRIEADDGGYWVRLVTWQALDREGACMRHCVGNGDYDRLVGGEDLVDDAIWSLRDRDGMSILTVRIRHRELNYAKGPTNHEPGRGASMQVRHLVAAFKAAGHALEVDRGTGIVLLEDGRTFRHDRLPPEVQAQREAAQRRREAARPPYDIQFGKVIFRPQGTREFVVIGDVGPFSLRPVEGPPRTMVESSAADATSQERQDPGIGLITQVTSNVTEGDVIDLRNPWAGSVYNVRDVSVHGVDGQPLANGPDYTVDAGPGLVMMRTAHDRVTIEFRAGPQPQRVRHLPARGDGTPFSYGSGGAGRVEAIFYPREGFPSPGGGGAGPGGGGSALAAVEWARLNNLIGPAPVAIPWSDVVLTDDTIRFDVAPDTEPVDFEGSVEILGEASPFGWSTTLE